MAESQIFSLPKPKRLALEVASDLRPEDISKSKSDTPVQPANPRITQNIEISRLGGTRAGHGWNTLLSRMLAFVFVVAGLVG